ncbi:MAG TPA: type II toxin-antitoxin system RelE/ParE family toxin [Bryobacterales bacterium]|nr:type II toxin-antitoxin system RelE/ParE family toxin [Bryobacterales bacterium]
MTSWTVELSEPAKKELGQLSGPLRRRITQKLLALENDPRPSSTKKLRASPARYRLRMGDYRVVYAVDDKNRVVSVERIRHRSDAYRGL